MNCHFVLWVELAYLVTVGLISWWIANRASVGFVSFLLFTLIWIMAGFVLFWVVEFAALTFATGGYARELGFCLPESSVWRMGEFTLLWIPLFLLASVWTRFSRKQPKDVVRNG